MKKFLFLNFGFEKPTPEIMQAWGKWFGSIGDKMIDGGQLPGGFEISKAGTKELTLGSAALTGFVIVEAEDMAAAKKIAQDCPIIHSIQVFEIASKK